MRTATILPFRRPDPTAAARELAMAAEMYATAGLCLWCAALLMWRAAMGGRR